MRSSNLPAQLDNAGSLQPLDLAAGDRTAVLNTRPYPALPRYLRQEPSAVQERPREVIDKVNAEVNRALADPKMRERLAELGGKPISGTPEDFAKVIAAETEKWAKIAKAAGVSVE